MKKSKVGRKPADGIRARTPCERQRKCRKQKELETENAINNISGSSTMTLLKVFQLESKRINQGEVDDRTVMRKIIVELCDRHEIQIEDVKVDVVGGLIDVEEEIQELHNVNKRLERVRMLISTHQSELDAYNSQISPYDSGHSDDCIKEVKEACACEEILLDLLHQESFKLSSK